MEEEIKKIATSIQKEFEIEIDNRKIICEFCNEFEKKIKDYQEDDLIYRNKHLYYLSLYIYNFLAMK